MTKYSCLRCGRILNDEGRCSECSAPKEKTQEKTFQTLRLAFKLTHDLDAWHERYEITFAEDQLAEASLHATRLIGLYLKADEPQLAARLAEDALDRIGADLPPSFYAVAGAQMKSAGETALAGLLYECLRNRHPHDPAVPVTLIREARGLERTGAGEDALQEYEAALGHPACGAALQEAAGQTRARLEGAPESGSQTLPSPGSDESCADESKIYVGSRDRASSMLRRDGTQIA